MRKKGRQKCVNINVKIQWICILTYLGFTYCKHGWPMYTQMGVYGEKIRLNQCAKVNYEVTRHYHCVMSVIYS